MHPPGEKFCLILAEKDLFQSIESTVKICYPIHHVDNVNKAISFIKQSPVVCIILHLDGHLKTIPNKFLPLKTKFPTIPVLAVLTDRDLELALKCGKIGVDSVILDCDLHRLSDIIESVVQKKSPEVSVSKFGIDLNHCSSRVRKALEILEERYLWLKSVREISDEMGISENTLSKYFHRYFSIGPKKLLRLLKIHHAVYLMKNSGLNLKEISKLVGYSNQRRFNESFHRVFGISPLEWRKRKIDADIKQIWQKTREFKQKCPKKRK